jgi:hypothetical protein
MPKRTSSIYIGVDPGQSGGIAGIWQIDNVVIFCKMPSTEYDICQYFRDTYLEYFQSEKPFALIERVHSMPEQGVSSTFKFGVNYGLLRGIITALDIPWEEVSPRTWQKGLGIAARRKATAHKKAETKTHFKNRLKARAQQLFPTERITLATCDALLIAEYCRRKHRGILK